MAFAVASMPPAAADEAAAPQVAIVAPAAKTLDSLSTSDALLNASDIRRYRNIFRLQRDGEWADAGAEIKALTDPLLMGHVLEQRYLHADYRSSYAELRDWLAAYADHPDADRVYKLALRRKPSASRAPERPAGIDGLDALADNEGGTGRASSRTPRSVSDRRLNRHIRDMVQDGRAAEAMHLLNRSATQRQLDAVSMAENLALVVRGHFHAGRDSDAIAAAAKIKPGAAATVPDLHWWAGLAAWRANNFATAAKHFEEMAYSPYHDDWTTSAAAFWAARANSRLRRFERVNGLLQHAAQHKRTFYGLLASRVLGEPLRFDWNVPAAESENLQKLTAVPAVRRALALIQIGESERAEGELRRFIDQISPDNAEALLSYVDKAGLSSLALRVGNRLLYGQSRAVDAALYPIPDWRPVNGFSVDRALIYALVRQESAFKPNAKSRSGASGLMQLMPQTARFIGGHVLAREGSGAIFDPAVNTELGQRYVRHLLGDGDIGGNLFFAIAAYNGGPGNLKKWRIKTDYQDDPLLFIESLPVRETREFVEQVLTNLWIYRHRLNQPMPSLDAVAAGEWPLYDPVEETELASRGN
ncbi:MAG: lytic transglycosylase domain-containing protein [Alphaproteobacteria bacterium]